MKSKKGALKRDRHAKVIKLSGAKKINKPNEKFHIKENEPRFDTEYLAAKHKLPNKFHKKTILEAESLPKNIDDAALENDRLDLRGLDIVTIDGDDAKDFDDAISIEKTDKGYDIGVHIADVSHFAQIGSRLDHEAYKRGNSVYLIDVVFPMFPEALSNGLCSLNENVTRFTLSVFVSIDFKGNVTKQSFSKTAICSKRRLTYNYAQDVLDGKKEDEAWLYKLLTLSNEAREILLKKRIEEGSIEFELDEVKIKLDKEGNPVAFNVESRKETHKIIEEFMLLANKTVAKYLSEHTDAIYRVHDKPDPDKINNFVRMAFNRGYKVEKDEKGNIDFHKFLSSIHGKPDEKLLITLLLRSMKQAIYDTHNVGHFGLGFEYYTHFTSPIRRYTDLATHRILKNIIAGAKRISAQEKEEMSITSEHCSQTERKAVDAERELQKIKGARYLKNHVGEKFDGIVSGVTEFGIFVEITEFGIEGLVRFQDMNDFFRYDENEHTAKSESSKIMYTLGDRVKIIVKKINIERVFVDFIFA